MDEAINARKAVRYPQGRGGYRVRESRLFRTEAEAQLAIDYNKNNK